MSSSISKDQLNIALTADKNDNDIEKNIQTNVENTNNDNEDTFISKCIKLNIRFCIFCGMASLYSLTIIAFYGLLTVFGIVDLYYAYTDESCINEVNPNINMTLKTWLLVFGYTTFATWAYLIILIGLYVEYQSSCTRVLIFSNSFIKEGFTIAWIIIGMVMVFKKNSNIDMCSNSLHDYLYAKLIIGLVGSCVVSIIKRNALDDQ